MRNKETGEFELVVGDKQLLSAFVIGVVLLGVVFAMGYVLGQSSPKSAKVAPETTTAPANAAAEYRPSGAAPSPVTGSAPPPTSTPVLNTDPAPGEAPPAEPPPQPTTVPAKEAADPEPPPKAQPAAEQPNGTYWQVLAGSQTSADALSQTLKGQGFPVLRRPGPKNLTLVWVGPYGDKESLARAKRKLEEAGFTNLFKKP